MATSEVQAAVTQRDAPGCAMAGEGTTGSREGTPTARERFATAVEAAGGSVKAAKVIGCTRAYVDMLVTGVRERPGMRVAYAIHRRLGIPMEAWMEASDAAGWTGQPE